MKMMNIVNAVGLGVLICSGAANASSDFFKGDCRLNNVKIGKFDLKSPHASKSITFDDEDGELYEILVQFLEGKKPGRYDVFIHYWLEGGNRSLGNAGIVNADKNSSLLFGSKTPDGSSLTCSGTIW